MAEIIKTIFELDVQTGEGEKNTRSLIAAVDKLKQSEKETGKTSEELKRTQASLDKILSQETKTITGLEAKQRLLRETLKTTTIGSNDFNNIQKKLIVTETQLARATGTLKTQTSQLHQTQSKLATAFKATAGVLGGMFAVGQLKNFIKESIHLGAELSKAEASLLQGLRGREDIQKRLIIQAKQLESSTGVDDIAIIQQQAFAASIGLTEDQINKVIPTAIDMSKVMGIDLPSAVAALSKTYGGNLRLLGALMPDLKEFTKAELESGEAIEAVSKKFGGQAVKQFEAGAAGIDRAKIALEDFQKEIGKALIPVLNDLSKELLKGEGIEKFSEFIIELVRNLDKLIAPIKSQIDLYKQLFSNISEVAGAFGNANEKVSLAEKIMQGLAVAMNVALIPLRVITKVATFFTHEVIVPLITKIRELIETIPFLSEGLNFVSGVMVRVGRGLGLVGKEQKKVNKEFQFSSWYLDRQLKINEATKKAAELTDDEKKALEERTKAVQFLTDALRKLNLESIKGDETRKIAELNNELENQTREIEKQQKLFKSGSKEFLQAENLKLQTVISFSNKIKEVRAQALKDAKKEIQSLVESIAALNIESIGDELGRELSALTLNSQKLLNDFETETAQVHEQIKDATTANDLQRAIALTDKLKLLEDELFIKLKLNEDKKIELITKTNEERKKLAKETFDNNINDFLKTIQIELDLSRTSYKRKLELIKSEEAVKSRIAKEEIQNAELLDITLLQIEEDAAFRRKALQQERLDNFLSYADQIKTAGLQIASDLISADQAQNDLAISNAQNRIDSLRSMADKGNVEILQAEEERLNKLTAQRAKFVRAQSALAQIEIVANSLIAISKAAAQGGIAAIITIPLTIAALIAGLAKARALAQASGGGFAEGVIDLQGKGTGKSDSIPARLSKGESVMTAKETQTYKPTLVAMRRKAIPAPVMNEFAMNYNSSNNFSGLERRVERVENAILELPKRIRINTQSLNITEKGLTRTVTNRQEKDSKISNPGR